MQYLIYILAGVFMMATTLQTLYIHDTNVLVKFTQAKDSHIERLEETVSYWKDSSINHSNNATFQRERCDAFYDVVGDYIDVTNRCAEGPRLEGQMAPILHPRPRRCQAARYNFLIYLYNNVIYQIA